MNEDDDYTILQPSKSKKEKNMKNVRPLAGQILVNWFIQSILLIELISGIIFYDSFFNNPDPGQNAGKYWMIFTGITYIIYIVVNGFQSIEYNFLINLHNSCAIHDYLEKLVATRPTISMKVRCYHTRTTIDRKGRRHANIVTTYRETKEFPIRSWKDVSGLFSLNNKEALVKKKCFVKLTLSLDISFANDGSEKEYESCKAEFKRRCEKKDEQFSFYERKKLDNFEKYNLCTISQEEPPLIGSGMFVLILFLGLVEFYKCYFNSYCIEQEFTIKKIVSANDFIRKENFEITEESPGIQIDNIRTFFHKNSSAMDSNYPLPTKEELEEAYKKNQLVIE